MLSLPLSPHALQHHACFPFCPAADSRAAGGSAAAAVSAQREHGERGTPDSEGQLLCDSVVVGLPCWIALAGCAAVGVRPCICCCIQMRWHACTPLPPALQAVSQHHRHENEELRQKVQQLNEAWEQVRPGSCFGQPADQHALLATIIGDKQHRSACV